MNKKETSIQVKDTENILITIALAKIVYRFKREVKMKKKSIIENRKK